MVNRVSCYLKFENVVVLVTYFRLIIIFINENYKLGLFQVEKILILSYTNIMYITPLWYAKGGETIAFLSQS